MSGTNEVELFQTLFVKCDICDTKLSCKETLRIHMRIHFGEKKEICNICSKTFLTKVNLSQHMRYHFQAFKKDHECGVCGYKTHEKSILRRHLQIHDGVKYKCNVCSQMCNTEISLKGHMKSKHIINRKSYNCEICEKSFNSTGSLYNHLKTHDQNIVKKYKCNLCDYKTWRGGEIKSHLMSHMEQKPEKFFCNTCDFKTWRKVHLDRHNLVHTSETPFTCNLCNVKVKSKFHLTAHQRQVHRTGKQFECDICSKSFPKPGLLKMHIERMHTIKEKLIKCHLCEKYFAFKVDLKSHLKVHDEPSRRFPCNVCEKSFTKTTHLERHKKLHTTTEITKPFKCDKCELSFRENYNLKRHIDRVHDKKIFKQFDCDKCSKKFNSKARLEDHKQLDHEKINQNLECNECFKTFPIQLVLKRHKRVVHRNPEHECKICHMSFKAKAKLERHNSSIAHKKKTSTTVIVTEVDTAQLTSRARNKTKRPQSVPTSKQPSYCILCYFDFKCNIKLKEHRERTHTTDEEKSTFDLEELKPAMLNFVCSLCKKRFLNINSVKYHRQYAHSEKNKNDEKIACEFCNQEFRWKNRANIKKHMMSIHNNFYYDLDKYCYSKRTNNRYG